MVGALIAGERSPKALAQLARSSMRRKITALEEAFTGRFTDHHAFLLGKMLARVDAIGADIAEIGADMTRFPTAAHRASRAKFAPGVKESAGKKKGRGSTGHGNACPGRILGEAAVAASQTGSFPGERCRRIARRRGSKKAIVAVGRSILVITWHLLSDPAARYTDLGSGFYDQRTSPERRKRAHVHQLEALGYKVTLEPAA